MNKAYVALERSFLYGFDMSCLVLVYAPDEDDVDRVWAEAVFGLDDASVRLLDSGYEYDDGEKHVVLEDIREVSVAHAEVLKQYLPTFMGADTTVTTKG